MFSIPPCAVVPGTDCGLTYCLKNYLSSGICTRRGVYAGNRAMTRVWRPEDSVPQRAFPFGVSTGTAVLAWVAKFALSVSKCLYH